jgi:hypothetical protein
MDINMVFTIPVEFHALAEDVAELTLGATCRVRETKKPESTHEAAIYPGGI